LILLSRPLSDQPKRKRKKREKEGGGRNQPFSHLFRNLCLIGQAPRRKKGKRKKEERKEGNCHRQSLFSELSGVISGKHGLWEEGGGKREKGEGRRERRRVFLRFRDGSMFRTVRRPVMRKRRGKKKGKRKGADLSTRERSFKGFRFSIMIRMKSLSGKREGGGGRGKEIGISCCYLGSESLIWDEGEKRIFRATPPDEPKEKKRGEEGRGGGVCVPLAFLSL